MKIEHVVISKQGKRSEMQDSYCVFYPFKNIEETLFAAVFDGHGESLWPATYAAENLPLHFAKALNAGPKDSPGLVENAFLGSFSQTSFEIREHNGGTCALACYLTPDKRLFTANAGDCGLLTAKENECVLFTKMHRVGNETERKRVEECGGQFERDYVWNSLGDGLIPLRSLGDKNFKNLGVISKPECQSIQLDGPATLLLATDGLFDVVPKEIIEKIMRGSGDVQTKASELTEAIKIRREPDNYTLLLINVN